MPELTLLPLPRQLTLHETLLTLPESGLILIDAPQPQTLRFTAAQARQALSDHAGRQWNIVASPATPTDQIALRLSLVPDGHNHPQGYTLSITAQGINAVAADAAGLFYAVQTLKQILSQSGDTVPQLRIVDWPDFAARGVMLDVSRDKVPTLDTLFELVDMLAEWKINELQLYTEHTFAYRRHPVVWAEASPITGEEILALDAYCRERFIDLVPNQNTFGHMRRWLVHPQYRPLSECPDGCDTRWRYFHEPFSLCPIDPGSLNLVRDMMDELLPHFSSNKFNVGCDETVDLGQGRSKEAVAERGLGRVYFDFLMDIYRETKARGRTMMFWGDIIMEYPELVPELPRDIIALEWGYEADHPFAEHGAVFAESGVPFYVCPGTSTWRTVGGRTENALGNLRNAAESGRRHGAVGYLNTDWGDNGHWQPLPVSYLGYAYGAAVSWATDQNVDIDIVQVLNDFAFRDAAGILGQLAYDLGNVYLKLGRLARNSTALFEALQMSPADILTNREGVTREGLDATEAAIDAAVAQLDKVQTDRPDAELLQREFTWAADMLRHACKRARWVLARADEEDESETSAVLAEEAAALLSEHRAVWLARNREGGLRESAARLETMARAYQG